MENEFAIESIKEDLNHIKSYNEFIHKRLHPAYETDSKLINQKYIVKVNDMYSVGKSVCIGKDYHKLVLTNTNFPEEFNSEDADYIIENITCTDYYGEKVIPTKVYWKDWYTERYKLNMEVICTMERIIINSTERREEE